MDNFNGHPKVAAHVIETIHNTIGSVPSEAGCMLGKDRQTDIISECHFDADADTSQATYSPSHAVRRHVNDVWRKSGRVRAAGFAHTHPRGLTCPSEGDLVYCREIFRASSGLDVLEIPICQTAADGEFSIHWWRVFRDGRVELAEPVIIEAGAAPPMGEADHPTMPRLMLPSYSLPDDGTFERVQESYDLSRMALSRMFIAGCGGAFNWVIALATAGVANFVLVDTDRFEASNICTTPGLSRRHLGRPKVEALADEIHDRNPHAKVVTVQKKLQELSAEEVRALALAPVAIHEGLPVMLHSGQRRIPSRVDIAVQPLTTIMAGMTDSFAAQDQMVKLAMDLRLPLLLGQVYEAGIAAEIVFTHPDQPATACPRCILAARYDAYERQGFVNTVSTRGVSISATEHLNAAKFDIGMALLHHGSDHPRHGKLLDRYGARNLVQIRLHPDCSITAFRRLSEEKPGMIGLGEAMFFKVAPKADCPYCGGAGAYARRPRELATEAMAVPA
jgi:molybdopterin/thiamine biosynthesis adenylyltransferase